MPRTKAQGQIFGLIMSYAMAIGMEVYNIAIKMGYNLNVGGFSTMTLRVFPAALKEAAYMGSSSLSHRISGATGSGLILWKNIRTRRRTTRISAALCARRAPSPSCVRR